MPRTNPFDPETPDTLQSAATLTGRVALEAAGDLTSVLVVAQAARSTGEAARRVDTTLDSAGQFLIELPSDTYLLEVQAPGYSTITLPPLTLLPGETFSAGTITLPIARGAIAGQVFLEALGPARQPAPADGANITLVREGDGTAYLVGTDRSGRYRADELPAGTYSVHAKREDFAPAYTPDPIEVQADAVAPAPDLTLHPASAIVQVRVGSEIGARYTGSRDVMVQLLAFVPHLTHMRVSESQDFTGADFRDFVAEIPFTLSDVDGEHTIYAQFRDKNGQLSDVYSTTVMLDREPPVLTSLMLAGGASFSAATSTELEARGGDRLSGVAGYQIAADGTLDDEPMVSVIAGQSLLLSDVIALSGADGVRTVAMRLADRAGNLSAIKTASVIKDTLAPTGATVSINTGNPTHTQSRSVTLTLAATDAGGITGVAVANGALDCATASYEPFVSPRAWLLSSVDGNKTVAACFRDAAGNTASASCAIVLDQNPPVITTFALASGASAVSTRTGLLLNVAASDTVSSTGALTMQVSEDPLAGATWDPYSASPQASLTTPGDGNKTLFLRVRDAAGNVADKTLLLVLDTTPPTTPKLQLAASFANSLGPVFATLGADGANQMCLYGDIVGGDAASCAPASSGWTGVTTSALLSFTGVDGPKTVFAKYRDGAGNEVVAPTGAVYKDTTVPELLGLTVAGGSGLTVHALAIEVAIAASGDRAGEGISYALKNSVGVTLTSAQPLPTGAITHMLPAGDKTVARNVDVCAKLVDEAGNPSNETCVPVVIDQRGALSGTVILEGETSNYAGASVSIRHELATSDAVPATTTNALGAYTLAGVPEGGGYNVTLAKTGFDTVVIRNVSITAGLTLAQGSTVLPVARGTLFGVARLAGVGGNQHGGILIGDPLKTAYSTVTGADGSWRLERIPIGVYALVASHDGYLNASYSSATVTANQTQDLGLRTLSQQTGDFRVCRVTDTTCATAVEFTGSRNVKLGLVTTDAVEYYASEAATGPTGFLALPTGNVADFQLSDADGEHTIYVWYRNASAVVSSMFSASVKLDRTPPVVSSVQLDSGATYTNNVLGRVSLQVTATDALSGVDDMLVSNDDSVFDGSDSSYGYAPSVFHFLPDADGPHTVYVRVCDALDNCTAGTGATEQDAITLDRVAPSALSGVSFLVNNGALATNTPNVFLHITPGDAVAVRFGPQADLSTLSYVGLPTGPTILAYTLSLPDDTRVVHAQFVDAAGNQTTAGAISDSILLDSQAPGAPSVSIDNGTHTQSSTLGVTFSATDATQMIVHLGTSADFSLESWGPYATTGVAAISGPNGTYSVYAKYRDAAGNETIVVSDSVVYDTEAPANASAAVIATTASDGKKYVASGTVDLDLFATGADRMIVAEDGTINGELPVAYATRKTVTLSPSGDGPREVEVQFFDFAGNASGKVKAPVVVDGAAPVLVSFTIAPSGYTRASTVALNIAATDASPLQMMLSNDVNFTGAQWQPYVPEVSWPLSAGTGTKNVYLKLKDSTGHELAPTSRSVVFDTDPPSVSVSIDSGAAYATTGAVSLTISAPDAVSMWVSNSPSFDGATAEPVGNKSGWPLTGGQGEKWVFVRAIDAAGNTADASDSIIYDRDAPTNPTLSVSHATAPAGYATSTAVTATLAAAGASQYCVSGDVVESGACGASGWADLPGSGQTALTLTAPTGSKTVSVRYRDGAGNQSSTASASIIYDAQKPTGTLTVASAGGFVTAAEVTLTITASDATSGVDAMSIANGTSCGGTYEPLLPSRNWTLDTSGGDGSKQVTLCLRDRAGWVSDPVTRAVTLDRAAPGGVSLSLAGGDDYVSSPSGVTATITATDSNALSYQLSEDPTFSDATWTALGASPSTVSRTLSDGDGVKTVYLRVRDAAGNTTQTLDSVVVDSESPYNETVALSPTTYTSSRSSITVTFGAVGAAERCLWGDFDGSPAPSCPSGGWTAMTASTSVDLTDGNGTRTVYVKYRDVGGLESATIAQDSVVLDQVAPAVSGATVTITGTARDGNDTAQTRFESVQVSLAGFSDATSGITQMLVSEDAAFAGAVWTTYTTAFGWVLSAGDGTKTLRVKLRDAAGNETGAVAGSIRLDTTPPALSVSVQGEGFAGSVTTATTRRRDVNLAVSVSDAGAPAVTGAGSLQFARDSGFTGAAWEAMTTTRAWNMVDPTTLTCRYSLVINEIDTDANDRVELANLSGAAVDLTGWSFTCGVTGSVTWTLPATRLDPFGVLVLDERASGSDPNTLYFGSACAWDDAAAGSPGYAILRDAFGSTVDFVRFNGSAQADPRGLWADDTSLTCSRTQCGRTSNLFDRDRASDFCVQTATLGAFNGQDCGVSTCDDVEGNRVVYVKVRDLAGNETIAVASTMLDMTPPIASLTLAGGATYSTASTVSAAIAASDELTGVSLMALGNGPTGATSFVNFSTSASHQLSAGDGTKRVFLRAVDAAGNEAPVLPASASIIVDGSAPAIAPTGVTLTGLAREPDGTPTAITRASDVTVTLSGISDATSGVADMRVWESGQTEPDAWQAYDDGFVVNLSTGDGVKTLNVRVRDNAGNTSSVRTGSITLDQTSPDGVSLVLANSADYTRLSTVDASVTASDAVSSAAQLQIQLSEDPSFAAAGTGWLPYVPAGTGHTVSLGSTNGNRTVYLRARDLAGNVSTTTLDQVFFDDLAPGTTSIQAVTSRTTSIYVVMSNATDPGESSTPKTGSGLRYYRVEALRSDGQVMSTVDSDRNETWITGLPSLQVYRFRARIVDQAGNTSAWSDERESLVGLNTTIADGFSNVGSLRDRIYAYRGQVLFPRALNDGFGNITDLELLRCDTRRQRCQDAGISQSVKNYSSTSHNTLMDVAGVVTGDSVWMFQARKKYGSDSFDYVMARKLRGNFDALADVSSPAWVDVGNGTLPIGKLEVDMWGGSKFVPGTLAAAANGKVMAVASLEGGMATSRNKIRVRICDQSKNCESSTDWEPLESNPPGGSGLYPIDAEEAWAMEDSSNTLSMDAGEHRLWIAYNYMDRSVVEPCHNGKCGIAVLSCAPARTGGTGCKSKTDWTRVKIPVIGYPWASRIIEADGFVYVFGVQGDETNATRGAYIWRCPVGDDPTQNVCHNVDGSFTSTDFVSSPLLKQLAMPALVRAGGNFDMPRLSFEWWGGYLHSSFIDYATGIVYYGRCKTGSPTGCVGVNDWTIAKLLESGDIRGQADMVVVQGNPIIAVGRDATRAFLLEPPAPAPLSRALVPDFVSAATGFSAVRATWSPRTAESVDGYRADYKVAPSGAGYFGYSQNRIAPDPSQSELAVSGAVTNDSGMNNIFGVVAAYKGQDLGMAEPHFRAYSAGRGNIGLLMDEEVAPRYASATSGSTCHVVAHYGDRDNPAIFLSACPKSANCTLPSSWKSREAIAARTGGFGFNAAPSDLSVAVHGNTVHLLMAYKFQPEDLMYQRRTLDPTTCEPSAAVAASVKLADGSPDAPPPGVPKILPSYLSIVADANRVYIGYARDGVTDEGSSPTDVMVSRVCDLSTSCDTDADFGTRTWVIAYRGGALSLSSDHSRLYWAVRRREHPSGRMPVQLYYCDTADCLNTWTAAAGLVPEGGLSGDLRVQGGRMLYTTDATFAWCGGANANCLRSDAWNRGWYSAEVLASTQPRLGILGTAANSLIHVGLGNDGHSVARCSGRCWQPDNWIGGFANRNPETSVTTSGVHPYFGPAGVINDQGEMTVLFRYRDSTSPMNHYWAFLPKAYFEYFVP